MMEVHTSRHSTCPIAMILGRQWHTPVSLPSISKCMHLQLEPQPLHPFCLMILVIICTYIEAPNASWRQLDPTVSLCSQATIITHELPPSATSLMPADTLHTMPPLPTLTPSCTSQGWWSRVPCLLEYTGESPCLSCAHANLPSFSGDCCPWWNTVRTAYHGTPTTTDAHHVTPSCNPGHKAWNIVMGLLHNPESHSTLWHYTLDMRHTPSVVPGPALGHEPSPAEPVWAWPSLAVMRAWRWLWPGLGVWKAGASGPSPGFKKQCQTLDMRYQGKAHHCQHCLY